MNLALISLNYCHCSRCGRLLFHPSPPPASKLDCVTYKRLPAIQRCEHRHFCVILLQQSDVIQSNPAISNSVNSKSPLFRRKIKCPWIYPSPLPFPGYFKTPLFQSFFSFPLGLRNSGVRLYLIIISELIRMFFISYDACKQNLAFDCTFQCCSFKKRYGYGS